MRVDISTTHPLLQVLSDDGHVYVLNSNPLLQPLLREAALCCVNPNMWFMTDVWEPGSLSAAAGTASGGSPTRKVATKGGVASVATKYTSLFRPEHQPNRQLLAARGIAMVNPHCSSVRSQVNLL